MSTSRVIVFRLSAILVLITALTGCGHLNGWGQVGPDLKPRVGAAVSIPLGSK